MIPYESEVVKVSPLQAMKAHGDLDARVHIYTATALGGCSMASPTLGHLYPGGKPRYSFYRRLSGSQNQSGHQGVKKISTPLVPGIEPGPSSTWPSALPLELPAPLHMRVNRVIL